MIDNNPISKLVDVFPFAKALAVDAGEVFWTDADLGSGSNGRVGKAAVGGGASAILSESFGLTGDLLIRDDMVVWVSPQQIRCCRRNGGANRLLATSKYPVAIAANSDALYFVDFQEGTIRCVPLAGGNVSTLSSGLQRPARIAVDAHNVVVAEWGPGAGAVGSIRRMPVEGGPLSLIADDQDRPQNLVLHNGEAYWVAYGDGDTNAGTQLRKANVTGGAVSLVARFPQHSEVAFSFSGSVIYVIWGNPRASVRGGIGRISIDGGNLEVIAEPDQCWPQMAIAHEGHFYWLNSDPGAIFRMPIASD